ncbi:M23 family metallopeptidase [Myxosarcina sp. GI1(2024)]
MSNFSLFFQLLFRGSNQSDRALICQQAPVNSFYRRIRRTALLFLLGLIFFCSTSAFGFGRHQLFKAVAFTTAEHRSEAIVNAAPENPSKSLELEPNRQNVILAQLSSSNDSSTPVAKIPKLLDSFNENKVDEINNQDEENRHSSTALRKELENSFNSTHSTSELSSNSTNPELSNRQASILLEEQTSLELPPLSSPEEYLPETFEGYTWPAQGTLTSGYGWRWGRLHQGIDIAAPIGTPIIAAAAGTVITADWNSGGYGKLIKLQHSDGSITLYAHNNKLLVSPGQTVQQNQQIAEMGNTGYSTGSHLHFEIHLSENSVVDPMTFLSKK